MRAVVAGEDPQLPPVRAPCHEGGHFRVLRSEGRGEDGIDQDCDGVDDACRMSGSSSASTASAILLGQAGESAGTRITPAGDINSDGIDDMWIGL